MSETGVTKVLVSVIVRAHDLKKDWILREALASLASQSYSPLEVVLTLQNYRAEDEVSLSHHLKKTFSIKGIRFQIVQVPKTSADVRSRALNMGISVSKGSRIAFLDYDDVVYPNAYEVLNAALDSNPNAGCAFGACNLAYVSFESSSQRINIAYKERFFINTPSVERLKHNSFTPIHSFLIDRNRLESVGVKLHVPEEFCLFEDYATLLRLMTKVPFDFSAFSKPPVCEYRVPAIGGQSILTTQKDQRSMYRLQRQRMWALRRELGFLNWFYWIEHPFYYPLKTKVYRLLNRMLRK